MSKGKKDLGGDKMTIQNRIAVDISGHGFTAGIIYWATGTLGTTKTTLINKWNLDATEQTQIDEIKAEYDSRNVNGKIQYMWIIEASNILLEEGTITGDQWKTALGVTA